MGIMPGDRLVYTAYASLNGKETYGETFRKGLAVRMDQTREEQAQQVNDLINRAQARQEEIEAQIAAGKISKEEERSALQETLALLESAIAGIKDQSNKVIYEQQLAELDQQLAKLKPMKLFKRQELNNQIAATKEKIEQIDEALAETIAPLEAQIEDLQARIG